MKKTMAMQLNTSWLSGKYTIDNQLVEINTKLPYIGIEGARLSFFEQGDNAQTTIDQIHQIWINGDLTVESAIQMWINQNL